MKKTMALVVGMMMAASLAGCGAKMKVKLWMILKRRESL